MKWFWQRQRESIAGARHHDVDGDSGQKYFMDKRVRMAVAHAISRESITKNMVGPASVLSVLRASDNSNVEGLSEHRGPP